MKSLPRFLFFLFAIQLAAVTQGQVIKTLNLDFGNGAAYVGDDGVLSSAGGTFWNKVNIDSNGIVPLYSFLDEFGQPFVPNHGYLFTEVYGTSLGWYSEAAAAEPNTSTGEGPLSDGVTFMNDNPFLPGFALQIREFTRLAPVSVVIYFNDPDPLVFSSNQVEFTTWFGNPSGVGGTVSAPTGVFPGISGIDYLQFGNVPLVFTTIGWPPTLGVGLSLPPGSTTHIAAMQIRGHFASVPEPSSIMLLGTWICLTLSMRRRR